MQGKLHLQAGVWVMQAQSLAALKIRLANSTGRVIMTEGAPAA